MIQAADSCVSLSAQTHLNVPQRVETRGVASVDADGLSERSGHELPVAASCDAVARLRGRLHLMRDGVRGLVYSPLDGNQRLWSRKGCRRGLRRAIGWWGWVPCISGNAGVPHHTKDRRFKASLQQRNDSPAFGCRGRISAFVHRRRIRCTSGSALVSPSATRRRCQGSAPFAVHRACHSRDCYCPYRSSSNVGSLCHTVVRSNGRTLVVAARAFCRPARELR